MDKNPNLYYNLEEKLGFPIVEEYNAIMSPKPQMGVAQREELVEDNLIYNFTSTWTRGYIYKELKSRRRRQII